MQPQLLLGRQSCRLNSLIHSRALYLCSYNDRRMLTLWVSQTFLPVGPKFMLLFLGYGYSNYEIMIKSR